MNVSINHPTDRPNFSIVTIGELDLAFSYRTVIGVRRGWDEWQLTRNYWGPTTGKHLNYLDNDHSTRLTAEEFAEIVKGLEIEVSNVR